MNDTTVNQLVQLNQQFYQAVGDQFSSTRERAWEGWRQLSTFIADLPEKIRVLDLGCGNGRFGVWLHTEFPEKNIQYIGIDHSPLLLSKAAQTLGKEHVRLIEQDLIRLELAQLGLAEFDLVVAFGVFHHIPGVEHRQRLFSHSLNALKPKGIFIASFWQFLLEEKWQKRTVSWDRFPQIDRSQLDDHDVLLDWQRDWLGFRYCHHTTNQEIQQLLALRPVQILDQFSADGPRGKSNRYVVVFTE